MPLEAYKRRHSSACLKRIRQRVAAGEIQQPDDLEQYRPCRCAWWVRGTTDLGKVVPRHSLKVHTWEAACAELKKLNQPDHPHKVRKSLPAAKEEWIAELKTAQLEPTTIDAYDLAARTLLESMAQRRVQFVQEITPELLTAMRAGWTVGRNTHNTYKTQIGTFLNFCVRMEWLTANPMKKTLTVRKKVLTEADLAIGEDEDDETATMPLDEEGDENYQKVCTSLIPFLRNELARPDQARKRERRSIFLRHPENCLALCHLMYETGLRISDATFFNPEKMVIDEHGASYTTRQIKTRRWVTVFLDPWLAEEIQALPRLFRGYPFYDGSKDWRRFINNNIRPVLRKLGEVLGMQESLRPHRFRDSFAVNRLNEGMSLDDLKTLLGHANVAMTERYYSPWVKSRHTSLRSRVRAHKEAHRAGKVISIAQKVG